MKRGLLIVFEGCDRSGKSTQCRRVIDELNRLRQGQGSGEAKAMRFPDRTTNIGKMLDGYLRGTQKVDDHAVHLLFSANRWEKVAELKEEIAKGNHVIVDRYAFSGVAFSSAKDGLSLEWCKNPDRGLPKPDVVCFLDVSPEEAKQRGGFGDEIYEKGSFQERVRKRYEELKDDSYWRLVDTDGKTQDQVFDEVMKIVTDLIDKSQGQDLAELWSTPTSPVNGNPKRPRLSRSENFQTNTNSNGIEH